MKILYTYILVTKNHKFHCIQTVGFLQKKLISQNCQKFAENTHVSQEKHVFLKKFTE